MPETLVFSSLRIINEYTSIVHAIPNFLWYHLQQSFPVLGSFAVQFGIISDPGIVCGPGSFVGIFVKGKTDRISFILKLSETLLILFSSRVNAIAPK